MVQIQVEESTHHEHHVGGLSQCLRAPILPHLALFSRGDHCSRKSYHRVQIPEQPLNDCGKFGVRHIPLQYTKLGGRDLCHLLQHHLLSLGLPGRHHYTLQVDRQGIFWVKLRSPLPLVATIRMARSRGINLLRSRGLRRCRSGSRRRGRRPGRPRPGPPRWRASELLLKA